MVIPKMDSHLLKEVRKKKQKGFSAWGFVELVGMGVGVTNLPLGLVMIVGATLAESFEHSRKLSDTRMSDGWMA